MKKLISLILCLLMSAALLSACSYPDAHSSDNPSIPNDLANTLDIVTTSPSDTTAPSDTTSPTETDATFSNPTVPTTPISITAPITYNSMVQSDSFLFDGKLIATTGVLSYYKQTESGYEPAFLCNIPDCKHGFSESCPAASIHPIFHRVVDAHNDAGYPILYCGAVDREATKIAGSTQCVIARYDYVKGEKTVLCTIPEKFHHIIIYGDYLYCNTSSSGGKAFTSLTYYLNKNTGGEPISLFNDNVSQLLYIVNDHYIYRKYKSAEKTEYDYYVAPMNDISAAVKLDIQKCALGIYAYAYSFISVSEDGTVYVYDTNDVTNPRESGKLNYFTQGSCIFADTGKLFYDTSYYKKPDLPAEYAPNTVVYFDPDTGESAIITIPYNNLKITDILGVRDGSIYVTGAVDQEAIYLSMDLVTNEITVYNIGNSIVLN